jgi:iron complex outermembrane receptor protein
MNRSFRLTAMAHALLMATYASAQTPDSFLAAQESTKKLDEIVVTGNPLKSGDPAAPVSVLAGSELLLKRSSTLGETLNGMPGVANSFFGPNAGRPIIRGLDGDRIRILNNQGASFDASTLSFDHNPTIDPLAIERIEVLRGPASLLYGGAAIGGVVNVIDNRIPKYAVNGAGGTIEARFGGAERENGYSGLMEAGNGQFAIHADGFWRDTDDYAVPESAGVGKRVINSASRSKGGAIGASFTYDRGYFGVSQSDYRSQYGTVAEADVTIAMKQSRSTFEGEFRELGIFIESVNLRGGRTDYKHTEFEGAETGTVFTNKGSDFRLEAKHAKLGPLSGVIGVQGETFRFAALGEEAFVPNTRTRNEAIFAYEELLSGAWKFSFGARAERSRMQSSGEGDSGIARFGAATEKSFNISSTSAGALLKLNDTTSLTANLAASQRAPAFYELFANGAHVATAAYEVGDINLQREKSTALDVGLQWKFGASRKSSARLGVFTNRFNNFIALRRTGIDRDAEGNAYVSDCGDGTSSESGCTAAILPEFRYQGVKARLSGFEAEGKFRLVESPYTWDLDLKADFTRAQDLTNNEPLPRIAPLRLTAASFFAAGPWALKAEVEHAARQSRVPEVDLAGPTASYTLLNIAASYALKFTSGSALFFVKANNLADRVAFNASSIDTIRGLAPLPGRGVKAGVQVTF